MQEKRLVCTYLSKESVKAPSSSTSLPRVMFFSLLQRTGVDLDVDGCIPGRVRFTSQRMSESLVCVLLLGELGKATTSRCFWARWNLQRNEPGWFVGEHIHVIFTGEDDLFDARSFGRRLSGDRERRDDGPSDTVGLLPTLVWRDRGLRTALRSLEAFMMIFQKPALHFPLKNQEDGMGKPCVMSQ